MTKPRELGDNATKVINLILEDTVRVNRHVYEVLEALALNNNADAVEALAKVKKFNRRIESVCWALLRKDINQALERATKDEDD